MAWAVTVRPASCASATTTAVLDSVLSVGHVRPGGHRPAACHDLDQADAPGCFADGCAQGSGPAASPPMFQVPRCCDWRAGRWRREAPAAGTPVDYRIVPVVRSRTVVTLVADNAKRLLDDAVAVVGEYWPVGKGARP
jgi:hypothetical protein